MILKSKLTQAVDHLIKTNYPIPLDLMVLLIKLGVKTYEYFLHTLTRMVRNAYDGDLGGEFVDIMKNLILGQISQAFETAWVDDGNELPPPDYIRDASQEMVRNQWIYVPDFYKAIVDARIDKTPIDPLLARAELWANQYNTAYNECRRLIAVENGDKLEWVLGLTEHCDTCLRLNGIVAYAKEWEDLGVHPGGTDNQLLDCRGYRCQCSLEVTTRRRSPNAYSTIIGIVSR